MKLHIIVLLVCLPLLMCAPLSTNDILQTSMKQIDNIMKMLRISGAFSTKQNQDSPQYHQMDIEEENDWMREKHESPENIDADLADKDIKIEGQYPGDKVGDGDIMMAPGEEEAEFQMDDQDNDSITQSNGEMNDIATDKKRWPKGYVPYVFDTSLGNRARGAVMAAVREFNRKSCIKLRPRKSEENYLRIYKGDGCWSYIGMRGGQQDLSLGNGCEDKGTAIHEVMHALGFWHEQSRPDRDQYVTILWNNIESGQGNNFNKKKISDVTYLGHGYDYRSIMHYSKTEFGIKNSAGRRLQTIKPKTNTRLGQCFTCGMSATDQKQIKALYCCRSG